MRIYIFGCKEESTKVAETIYGIEPNSEIGVVLDRANCKEVFMKPIPITWD